MIFCFHYPSLLKCCCLGGHKSLSHDPSENAQNQDFELIDFEYDCFKNSIVDVIKYSTNHNKNRGNGMLLFFEVYLWKWAGAYWKTYLQLHPLSSLSEKCSIRKENVPRYQSEQFFSSKKIACKSKCCLLYFMENEVDMNGDYNMGNSISKKTQN